MRLKSLLIVLLCLPFINLKAQGDDGERFAAFDELLSQFYATLVHEPMELKTAEMDKLIESCKDSLLRQHVTISIFEHYKNSRVMGEEAVAIHVYDKWIDSGEVGMRGEFERMEAEMFVTFNRNSLLGMKAAEIELYAPDGSTVTIPREGKMGVLFFYDTSCAKCRLETQLLPSVLATVDFPLNFYAIYAGAEKEQWETYRKEFSIQNPEIEFFHLWDPEMDSDYQLLYAVTATPRIFFVKEDGEIIGRRLEVSNLQQIIDYVKLVRNFP